MRMALKLLAFEVDGSLPPKLNIKFLLLEIALRSPSQACTVANVFYRVEVGVH